MNEPVDAISTLYFSKRHLLAEKKYHYMVRSMLFEGRKFKLEDFDSYFNIGNQDAYYQDVSLNTSKLVKGLSSDRKRYAEKYEKILKYEQYLIRGIFGKYLFNINPNYAGLSKEFIKEFSRDEEAIKSLSTYAVNAIRLANKILEIDKLPSIDDLVNMGFRIDDSDVNRKVYFFTHLVIAESLFYTENIELQTKDFYRRVLGKIEKLIIKKYSDVYLDAKLEYLLATKMVDGYAGISKKIMAEVISSISPQGYIDDFRRERHTLEGSEHRNMLYLGLVKWNGGISE